MGTFKILIMGLPGSGKTTLANFLCNYLTTNYLNADLIRAGANDWDFSEEGRLRQAQRMVDLCRPGLNIADFVCPTEETRKIFAPDFTIFMNTIAEGRFEDTNKVFEKPDSVDHIITRRIFNENHEVYVKECHVILEKIVRKLQHA